MKTGPEYHSPRPFGGGAGGALVPPASYPLSGLTCSCSLASASNFEPYIPERLEPTTTSDPDTLARTLARSHMAANWPSVWRILEGASSTPSLTSAVVSLTSSRVISGLMAFGSAIRRHLLFPRLLLGGGFALRTVRWVTRLRSPVVPRPPLCARPKRVDHLGGGLLDLLGHLGGHLLDFFFYHLGSDLGVDALGCLSHTLTYLPRLLYGGSFCSTTPSGVAHGGMVWPMRIVRYR